VRRLADLLTLARALLGLPLLLALAADRQGLAWGLLLLGGLSDAADGWLARRAGGGSVWGARLDPLTDKILISAPLLWLAAAGRLPLWAVWLLLARELLISGWRAGQDSGGPASPSGKAKTVLQFLALLLLLHPRGWGAEGLVTTLRGLGWWLFWPSLLLALSSALGYLRPAADRPRPPAGPRRG
jgi:CDP-diacylglycerol--glycerol-3-phosphate 3-phosphatidyltransferase